MSENPLVSIIILNYNAGDLLLNCVDSVFKSTYPNFEVIIVDNLSTDNSHIRCKEKFEKIQRGKHQFSHKYKHNLRQLKNQYCKEN